jgi:uncharacterized membrane protein
VREFIWYASGYVVGEIIALIVFPFIRKFVAKEKFLKGFDIETLKGTVERLLLFTGLLFGYAPVLILFGTVKLGTRLTIEKERDKEEAKISNNYFLIGNFISALIPVVIVGIITHYCELGYSS